MRKSELGMFLTGFVLIFSAMFLVTTYCFAEEDLQLRVNGETVEADMYIENGRTQIEASVVENLLEQTFEKEFIALRQVFEDANANVTWVPASRTIEIELDPVQVGEAYLLTRIDVDHAMDNVQTLSKEIGPRPAGSDSEHQAAEFLADYYQGLGYTVAVQEYPVDTFGPENMGLASVELVDGEDWFGEIEFEHETAFGPYDWGVYDEWHGTEWQMGASPHGTMTDVTLCGKLVNAGDGREADFTEEVEGNIALVRRGEVEEYKIAQNADAAGAEAVIIYSLVGGRGNLGQAFQPRLEKVIDEEEEEEETEIVEVDIPVLGAAKIHGAWLTEMLEKDTVELCIDAYYNEDLISYNVEPTKPAEKEDAPIIAITGHFDSVIGAPGANDNASGTAATMEMARAFKGFDLDVELRFINFGAEEVGLVGSRYYVEQLSEEEKERFMGVYNPDMVGTSDPYVEQLFAQTVDGEPNVVTDSMLAADERLGHNKVKQSQFPASDHVPFHYAGIDAALFIHMAGEGTPQDYYIEPIYHTPQDTIEDNICPERYEQSLEILGAAVLDTAISQ